MSNDINELAAALVAAQAELTNPGKDKTAKITSKRTGQTFTYDFVSLDTVLDQVRPVLNKHGLAVQQEVTRNDNGFDCHTILTHTSGQWRTTVYHLACAIDFADPRDSGKAATYARRYGLLAAVGLQAREEDHEDAFNEPAPRRQQRPAQSKAQPKRDAETEYEEFVKKVDHARANADLKILQYLNHYAQGSDTPLAQTGVQEDCQRYVAPILREVQEMVGNLEEASS